VTTDQPPQQPGEDRPRPVEAPTGHAGVDAALARLADVEAAPTDSHPEVYDDVHRRLHDALSDLDGS